jgi:hypothetical protein
MFVTAHFTANNLLIFVAQATRLVTSSEDDASPIIMVWDLRNARAPEKVCDQPSVFSNINLVNDTRFSPVMRRVFFRSRGVS